MNILIASAGRRVKVVEYFKKALKEIDGKVVATDCDAHAPAIYFADEYHLVPRIDDPHYIENLLSICKNHNIKGVLSLIDPELELLAENETLFLERGIQLILSPLDMVKMSFDKLSTHQYLQSKQLPSVPTFNQIADVKVAIQSGDFDYPLIAKPRKGSSSLGILTIKNEKQLEAIQFMNEDLIVQPFYKDKEFGVDVYIDLITGELTDLFIKEKIRMRAGETDKSVSNHNKKIEMLVINFIRASQFRGPIDIDIFEYEGEYYISEINPRFGGGYPHAYECGVDFPARIIRNLEGDHNHIYSGFGYKEKQVLMKYDHVLLKTL